MHPFDLRLVESWPPADWHEVGVLVAVSGGADSVALVRGLAALKVAGPGRLVAAHFDHRLRGADSTADREFVEALCQRLGMECHVGQWTAGQWEPGQSSVVLASAGPSSGRLLSGGHPDGVEAAARAARYEFLQATAERLGARYVATAHTADDQAETVLHHIVRGTGLSGLAGMSRARPLGEAVTLIRPLLSFRRNDVVEYLGALGQSYCDDATNRDPAFTRGRIRHELLPLLARDYNPRAIDALIRLSTLAAEAQAAIDGLVADLAARCVVRRASDFVEVDLKLLSAGPRHLVRELFIGVWREQNWPLQAMGFDEWDQLAAMALASVAVAAGARKPGEPCPAKRVFPGGVVAERGRESLTLNRAAAQ